MFVIGMILAIFFGLMFQILRKGKRLSKFDLFIGILFSALAFCAGYFFLTNLTGNKTYVYFNSLDFKF